MPFLSLGEGPARVRRKPRITPTVGIAPDNAAIGTTHGDTFM